MDLKEISSILKLSSFPSAIAREENDGILNIVREYDGNSEEEQLAWISHLIHNVEDVPTPMKERLIKFFNQSFPDIFPCVNDEYALRESFFQSALFSEFNDVPFPSPTESSFRYVDLFAGIGGIRLPFHELGGKCVFSSEWDKAAKTTYFNNYGEIPFGDITKIDSSVIPHHDILLAGFPCQAFSIMGKMKGFNDIRGTMFFEVARILDYHKPKAILLENVKQLVSHDKGNTFKVIMDTLSQLGYHVKWKVLNALDFGAPQKRERVIIVGFRDKSKSDKFNFDFEKIPYNLGSIIEDDEYVDRKLFASQDILAKRQKRVEGKALFYPSVWHENKAGNISVLPYACALRTGASYNYLLINGVRRPSSRELLRFQGFPEEFRIAVSHSEIRRQTGNSVAVPVIRAVAKKIIGLLFENELWRTRIAV